MRNAPYLVPWVRERADVHRFENILFVCDEHSAYELALERVIWLAALNEARVTMVSTIDSGGSNDVSRLFSMIPGLGNSEIGETVIAVHRMKLEDRAQALRKHAANSCIHTIRGLNLTQRVAQHHRQRKDGGQRIGDALACDIGGRPMNGLVQAKII